MYVMAFMASRGPGRSREFEPFTRRFGIRDPLRENDVAELQFAVA